MKKIVTTAVLIGCAAIAVQAGQKTTTQGNKKVQTGTTAAATEVAQNPSATDAAAHQSFTYTNTVTSWYTPAQKSTTRTTDVVLGPTTRKQKQQEKKVKSTVEAIAYREALRNAKANHALFAQNQTTETQGENNKATTTPGNNQGQTVQTNKSTITYIKPVKKKRGCFLTRWAERQPGESIEMWNARLYQMAK